MISWLAAVIGIIGVFLVARHKWYGWILATLGSALWVIVGYNSHDHGLVFSALFFVLINSYGLYNYYKVR